MKTQACTRYCPRRLQCRDPPGYHAARQGADCELVAKSGQCYRAVMSMVCELTIARPDETGRRRVLRLAVLRSQRLEPVKIGWTPITQAL